MIFYHCGLQIQCIHKLLYGTSCATANAIFFMENKMRRILETMINTFTRVTSMIIVIEIIYIYFIFGENITLTIRDLLGVVGIGLISAISSILIIMSENKSKPTRLIIQIIYFLIINASVITIGFFLKWFSFQYKESVIAMEFVILLVYAIVMFISYKIDSSDIKGINEILKKRKEENK